MGLKVDDQLMIKNVQLQFDVDMLNLSSKQ